MSTIVTSALPPSLSLSALSAWADGMQEMHELTVKKRAPGVPRRGTVIRRPSRLSTSSRAARPDPDPDPEPPPPVAAPVPERLAASATRAIRAAAATPARPRVSRLAGEQQSAPEARRRRLAASVTTAAEASVAARAPKPPSSPAAPAPARIVASGIAPQQAPREPTTSTAAEALPAQRRERQARPRPRNLLADFGSPPPRAGSTRAPGETPPLAGLPIVLLLPTFAITSSLRAAIRDRRSTILSRYYRNVEILGVVRRDRGGARTRQGPRRRPHEGGDAPGDRGGSRPVPAHALAPARDLRAARSGSLAAGQGAGAPRRAAGMRGRSTPQPSSLRQALTCSAFCSSSSRARARMPGMRGSATRL